MFDYLHWYPTSCEVKYYILIKKSMNNRFKQPWVITCDQLLKSCVVFIKECIALQSELSVFICFWCCCRLAGCYIYHLSAVVSINQQSSKQCNLHVRNDGACTNVYRLHGSTRDTIIIIVSLAQLTQFLDKSNCIKSF